MTYNVDKPRLLEGVRALAIISNVISLTVQVSFSLLFGYEWLYGLWATVAVIFIGFNVGAYLGELRNYKRNLEFLSESQKADEERQRINRMRQRLQDTQSLSMLLFKAHALTKIRPDSNPFLPILGDEKDYYSETARALMDDYFNSADGVNESLSRDTSAEFCYNAIMGLREKAKMTVDQLFSNHEDMMLSRQQQADIKAQAAMMTYGLM